MVNLKSMTIFVVLRIFIIKLHKIACIERNSIA
nr:MAG TPA: hypothetical protein [Caudoviricetes sp.]